MRLSLRVKFSALVLGLILVMMTATWRLSIDQQAKMETAIAENQRSTMRGELAKRAGNIFSFLAANSEALAVGDYLTVDAFVRDITAGSSDIHLIQIVRNGRVVVPIQAGPQEFRPPIWLKPAGKSAQFELVETPAGEKFLAASGPIIDRSINVRVADAYVVISRKPIQDAIAAAQEQIKTFGRTVMGFLLDPHLMVSGNNKKILLRALGSVPRQYPHDSQPDSADSVCAERSLPVLRHLE